VANSSYDNRRAEEMRMAKQTMRTNSPRAVSVDSLITKTFVPANQNVHISRQFDHRIREYLEARTAQAGVTRVSGTSRNSAGSLPSEG
jgi:hypothetical protein